MWPLFLLCLSSGIAHSQVLDHRFFLVQILEKYGHNGSITYEGFERLYKNLGLGLDHTHKHEASVDPSGPVSDQQLLSRTSRGANPTTTKDSSEEQLETLVVQHEEVTIIAPSSPTPAAPRCLAPAQLLAVYGVPRSGSGLSPVSFLHLCPAIIYQLDQHSCSWAEPRDKHSHSHSHTHSHVENKANIVSRYSWLFALLTILVISVSGLLCVAIVPLLHKMFINQLISFLVALAVGTLLGDAFLHLIPHALESHGHGGNGHEHESEGSHTDSVLKTGLMFLTMVFFFTFEAVLNTNRRNKEKGKKEEIIAYAPVGVIAHQAEQGKMLQMMGDTPEAEPEVAEGHGHSHSHSNTAVMVIFGDGLHNLTDGLAIGAAFSGGLAPGFATAVAVFTHELPHELGDFAVLLQSGVTVRKALFYNIVSSVMSLLGVAIGLVVGNFGDATRWVYAITAGSFVYIALANLVPEINKHKCGFRTIILRVAGMLCGGAIMGSIALYEDEIQNLFS